MKVRDVLKDVFKVEFDNVLDKVTCWDFLSNDKNLINSHLDDEVVFLDHLGIAGLFAFKIRGGYASFTVNLPGHQYNTRANSSRQIKQWNDFKIGVTSGNNISIDNDDYQTYLALKNIEGGRL